MKTQKFITNIKCNGCIAKVKPFLDNIESIKHWEVDLDSCDRILTVETSMSSQQIIDLLQSAGYKGTRLQ